jgi:hypothetical protein
VTEIFDTSKLILIKAYKYLESSILLEPGKEQLSVDIPSIQTFVATHKNYIFPADLGYVPLHVGRNLTKEDFAIEGDNTGDNISDLNYHFCELTALYWIWKNRTKNIRTIGLVHYRRHFKAISKAIKIKDQSIASSTDLEGLMRNYEIILPEPRNYWIETIEEHYANAHYSSDLFIVKDVLLKKYPQYEKAFNQVVKSRKLSLYNMFLMKKEHFDAYCSWLFDILFEVERIIPYRTYGPYQGRVFGFLGERLLNVWVNHNFPPQKVKYLPVTNLEGENLFMKGIGLLRRKYQGVKLK